MRYIVPLVLLGIWTCDQERDRAEIIIDICGITNHFALQLRPRRSIGPYLETLHT